MTHGKIFKESNTQCDCGNHTSGRQNTTLIAPALGGTAGGTPHLRRGVR